MDSFITLLYIMSTDEYNHIKTQNSKLETIYNNFNEFLTTNDTYFEYYSHYESIIKNINFWLLIVYVVLFLTFSYFFLFNSNIHGFIKFCILVILIVYPFYITNFENLIYKQYSFLRSIIRSEPYERE